VGVRQLAQALRVSQDPMEPHRLKSVLLEGMRYLKACNFRRATNNMWRTIMSRLGRHLRSRYVLLLEEETARLRAENRALVNSLLGTAGFPPISPEDDARRGVVGLPPVRRRTWTQIARERELAAGRGATEK